MQTTKVRRTTADDEAHAIDTIVLAFAADPVARWSWPDSRQYLTSMPDFVRAFAGKAFSNDSSYCSDDHAGASLWLPPNIHPDEEAVGEILQRTISPNMQDDLFAVFEQMASYHPNEPHWYLPLIGVDPAHQGKGYGGALLAFALQECDRQHLPAYLESTNLKNVPLYQRHGFEVMGEIQVGSSPRLIPMLRRSR